MSFLERNEYLLTEIEYYHEQILSRLTDDAWSGNYRELWDAVCLQLNWHGYTKNDKPQYKMINNLLRNTRYGRVWPFDSPILNGNVALLKNEHFACKTLFEFQLYTNCLGSWEPLAYGVCGLAETLLVLRLLPYTEQFIDVGANTGYYSFLAAQHGIPVVAMEPSPLAYGLLVAGKELNGFANFHDLRYSISEAAGGAAFYLENGDEVRALTLTDYRAAGSLIKLSVAGFEVALLRGTSEWLAAYDAPVVLVEAGPDRTAYSKSNHKQIVGELEKYNYSVYALNPKPEHGSQLLSPVSAVLPFKRAMSYLALPPMAKDLAGPLDRMVDMRVFTPSNKLESLHHFVQSSFESLY